ncbi:O-glucosyltransferase rumi homolog [Neltuma alba]|uniref:O-glucosyltransferase rumi homolog n=1 Tax=Neltuma alba TaxID=207710 RepID=UPI0010A3941C|nr:O-glucosyltransferase rumi homolog [Prosopis alba]
MGLPSKSFRLPPLPRLPCLFSFLLAISLFSLTAFVFYKWVDDVVSQTKTVVGHNLKPTPWHIFPLKTFDEETRQARAYKILQCSFLTCGYRSDTSYRRHRLAKAAPETTEKCPEFFGAIHRDLQPWAETRISKAHLEAAQKYAAFRVVIVGGKLYVDLYYACVQSRAMFTIWGFFQLLRRYPGIVPDVDMMFDCMDKPTISRTQHQSMPLPLFRYCTSKNHFDIPFPDWSFWGWPEINIRPWQEEFPDIKEGSQSLSWRKKVPRAYWKGNPDVSSPIRTKLLKCNHSRMWRAQVFRQDWGEAARSGFQQSKLSKQCNHRYKIYAEGYAWSVSLKYILSCDSVALIISPRYEDFFSRGLIPRENFLLIDPLHLCPAIKDAVDWGNEHENEAEAIGRRGQELMESLSMDRVYDYMFHLISEYSKLQDFRPTLPSTAMEACAESLLCFADEKQRNYLNRSMAFPSQTHPCTLP